MNGQVGRELDKDQLVLVELAVDGNALGLSPFGLWLDRGTGIRFDLPP